jgi:hypothetical protein
MVATIAALALVASSGCGDPTAFADTDDVDGLDGRDDAGDQDGQADGDQATPIDWVPAHGISIVEVEANQGTRIAITNADGDWVGPGARNMRLVGDRDTLLRVHWEVEPGWQPHDVLARLTLDTGSGDPIVREQTLHVASNSSRTGLDRAFYFGLTAARGETVPGAKFEVELFEAAEHHDTSLAEARWAAPARGPELLGFESDPMQLKVLLVPIHYTGGGHDTIPDLSEDRVAALVDSLHERNPVQEIVYQVRGQIGYAKPMANLGELLPLMSAVKHNDGADPNVYYHAFIDIGCPVVGCGAMGVAGIAVLAGPGKDASLNRVGATVWWRNPNNGRIDQTVDTFVHEVGHNQGLGHVACPGIAAAGPDPSYPYADGKIGQWGFGIRSFSLHNPTSSHDYMTYCGNTWGSDWTYLKAYDRIRALTRWDTSDQAGDASREAEVEPWLLGESVLVGALYPDGAEQWFTLPGGVEAEELVAGEAVVFESGGQRLEQPAKVMTLSDGETQWVVSPLPDAMTIDQVDQVEHIHEYAPRRVIPRAQITVDFVAGTDITL